MLNNIAEKLDCFVEKIVSNTLIAPELERWCMLADVQIKDVWYFCLPKRYSGRYSSQVCVPCGFET